MITCAVVIRRWAIQTNRQIAELGHGKKAPERRHRQKRADIGNIVEQADDDRPQRASIPRPTRSNIDPADNAENMLISVFGAR